MTATHPSESSTGQFLHYVHNILSGGFNKYDHGFVKNLAKYGTTYPPAYNTSNIVANTYLYYAENDFMSHPTDVEKLASELKNLCALHRIDDRKWNHVDYAWANNVMEKINIPLRDRLLAFDRNVDLGECK